MDKALFINFNYVSEKLNDKKFNSILIGDEFYQCKIPDINKIENLKRKHPSIKYNSLEKLN